MEFKQPTRYSRVPPRSSTPTRSAPFSTPQYAPQPITVTPPQSKKTGISPVRIFLSSKKVITSAIILVLLIGAVIAFVAIREHSQSKSTALIKDPGYHTILPAGASITGLGGWERVSPPESAPVYAYADKIDDVAISVSEQPLPASFKEDPSGQVSELAKAYNATDTIGTAGTTVYIGTSAKGPQSVIFIKNDLLILIKSHAKIEDKAWVRYISSLG